MNKARSIGLSVLYRNTPYSVLVQTVEQVEQAEGSGSAASASSGGGATAGAPVTLNNTPLYVSSTAKNPATHKTGTYYYYDGILINGRYRITNTPSRVGKTPVGQNVTGWMDAGEGGTEAAEAMPQTTATKIVSTLGAGAGTDIAPYVENLTYVDNAADDSDTIDITLDAQDRKWLWDWMPQKGTTLYPRLLGHDWNRPGDERAIDCGLFVVDDVNYSDTPTTLQLGGVSKPSDSNFSETDRATTWKNTSVKRIGETIAARYGLGFTYDAEDYEIECDEQDGTDSSYYNSLCQNYGLVLKVYARRLWVYDREAYKAKRAVRNFDRTDIIRGSLSWTTTLSGTYTGGTFDYTDADKDCDISCAVGGGTHIKAVNRRATSVQDAAVQLCAELNRANHGTIKLRFSVPGDWSVSAGNTITITGYGGGPDGGEGGINGKYFVDKVTHKYAKSGGFTTAFECSGVRKAFHPHEVGGTLLYNTEGSDVSDTEYSTTYETSTAANAASAQAGAEAGAAVTLDNAPFYYTSTAPNPSCYKSGVFYFYDGILINGRYRMTNSADRCGKLPVGQNVTGWVPVSYCGTGESE
ncbi:MAG: hypothetical protein J6J43_03590 [Oscillospiraceae bacterium]|nr:hypothetical protein [Oscillospiraceae bacterium]